MRKAFTLTEILIVLACFAVVAWVVRPAVVTLSGVVASWIVDSAAQKAKREIKREIQAEAAKLNMSKEATEVWVEKRLEHMKEEWQQREKLKELEQTEERRRKEEESAKKWSGYQSKAMMAVIGLFVFLGVARMAPPVSRAIAAVVVKRVAPQPRAIDVPDEDR